MYNDAPPATMLAQVVRQDRFGEPTTRSRSRRSRSPRPGPRVLVYVMAAGVNYNNVWAAMGIPIDVIKARQKRRRAGGLPHRRLRRLAASCGRSARTSRTSRSATRSSSTAACGTRTIPWVKPARIRCSRRRPRSGATSRTGAASRSSRRCQDHQCLPKPPQLTWEEAAALHAGRRDRVSHAARLGAEHRRAPATSVLVWGGAGGLGSMAIQIARAAGARPVAVVSGDEQERVLQEARRGRRDRSPQVRPLGQAAALGRRRRQYASGSRARARSARRSGRRSARGKNPTIVFEHPGETTHADLDASCARPAAWS